MVDLNQLKQKLIQECNDDFVFLWSIIWVVRYALNGNSYPLEDRSNPSEVRRLSIALMKMLLDSGEVLVGGLTADGNAYEPWPLLPAEALARINAEWDSLAHEPNMVDMVAIFTSPQHYSHKHKK